jgi:type II secretory pathway pseudopilin PulG
MTSRNGLVPRPACRSAIARYARKIILPVTLNDHHPHLPSHRRALTLLEIVLVMALIVIVVAIAVPTTMGVFSSQRLAKSAELVRSKLSRARVEAMRSGQIQAFHFQMGGTKYVTVPWYAADETTSDSEGESTGFGMPAEPAAPLGMANPRTLPDGITFVVVIEVADTRAETLTQQAPLTLPLDEGDETPWSPPILFYPDGTASEAQIHLANNRGWTVAIELRGVTGSAQVGDLEKQVDPLARTEETQ